MASKKKLPHTIYLSDEEAEVFKWCWKHYEIWLRAMELAPGMLAMHFNKKNDICKKEFHQYESEDGVGARLTRGPASGH